MGSKPVERITSIKEIAKIAKCSIATVSNALNGKGRISQEVRDQIRAICKKHNYTPNSAGRNLRLQRAETVGVLFFPSCAEIFRNVFYAKIMESLERELDKRGYDLLLAGFETTAPDEVSPRFIRQGKVDGVILLGNFPRNIAQNLSRTGLPLLLLDNDLPGLDIDSVTTDGFRATSKIVDHLYQVGHRDIVFLAYENDGYNSDQRQAGFEEGVKRFGLPETRNFALRNFKTSPEGYEILAKLMQSERKPTAVIAVNDDFASYLQGRLQLDGHRVPQDVSVFGFDDDHFSSNATPKISTVLVDTHKIGRIGAETLLARIETPETGSVSIRVGTELLHRDSVAPPQHQK